MTTPGHQAMQFNLRDIDRDLMRAAITFGDWLAKRPECDVEDLQVIQQTQALLRNLPDAQPTEGVGFDFSVDIIDRWVDEYQDGKLKKSDIEPGRYGFYRNWGVGYSGNPPTIELGSLFNDHPRPPFDDNSDAQHEIHYSLTAGEPNRNVDYDCNRWINEVRDLDQFLTGDRILRVATTGDE